MTATATPRCLPISPTMLTPRSRASCAESPPSRKSPPERHRSEGPLRQPDRQPDEGERHHQPRGEVGQGRPEGRAPIEVLRLLVDVDAQRVADVVGERDDEQAAHQRPPRGRGRVEADDEPHAGDDGRGAAEAHPGEVDHSPSSTIRAAIALHR